MATVIGTAGWAIPAAESSQFGPGASTLERYASRFKVLEINSSFHRSHRQATWERWAAAVPDDFRFSVKLPKTITHKQKLADCETLVADFVVEAGALGSKLAVVLVQLPPSLAFEEALVGQFLAGLTSHTSASLVCEPRHPSWFYPEVDDLLAIHRVARVAADPSCVPEATTPGGWQGMCYFRLHGSPQRYRSSYDEQRLRAYAAQMTGRNGDSWCIFDNTASGAATANALSLAEMLS